MSKDRDSAARAPRCVGAELREETIANRRMYADILDTADGFLDNFVAKIETLIDPHNTRALTTLIRKMSKDNVMKSKPPRYAAGTGFAKMLTALNTLSRVATDTCSPEIAAAVNANPTTIPNAGTTTTGGNANAPNSNTDKVSPHSYIAALRTLQRPHPIPMLSISHSTRSAATVPEDTWFDLGFRRKAAMITDKCLGHETKNLLEVKSD